MEILNTNTIHAGVHADAAGLALYSDLHRLRDSILPLAHEDPQTGVGARYVDLSAQMENELLRVLEKQGIEMRVTTAQLRYGETAKKWLFDDVKKGLVEIQHEIEDAASELAQELFNLKVGISALTRNGLNTSNWSCTYHDSYDQPGLIATEEMNQTMNGVLKRQRGLEHLLKDRDGAIESLKGQLHAATVSAQAALESAHVVSEQAKHSVCSLRVDVERFSSEAAQLRERLQQRDRRISELEQDYATKSQGTRINYQSGATLLKAELEDMRRHLKAREKVLEDLANAKIESEEQAKADQERLQQCIKDEKTKYIAQTKQLATLKDLKLHWMDRAQKSERLYAEAEERISKLRAQVSDNKRLDKCGMQAALASKDQHNRDLEESLEKAAIQRDELWNQILDLKENLSSALVAQKESEARADALQERLSERKVALQEALDSEVEQRNVAEHRAEQAQKQLGVVKEELKQKVEDLEKAERELVEARRSSRRLEEELDREQSRAARDAREAGKRECELRAAMERERSLAEERREERQRRETEEREKGREADEQYQLLEEAGKQQIAELLTRNKELEIEVKTLEGEVEAKEELEREVESKEEDIQALKRTLREVVEARDKAETRERRQTERAEELGRELRHLRAEIALHELAAREKEELANTGDVKVGEMLDQLDTASGGVQNLLECCMRVVADLHASADNVGEGVKERLLRLSAPQLTHELRGQVELFAKRFGGCEEIFILEEEVKDAPVELQISAQPVTRQFGREDQQPTCAVPRLDLEFVQEEARRRDQDDGCEIVEEHAMDEEEKEGDGGTGEIEEELDEGDEEDNENVTRRKEGDEEETGTEAEEIEEGAEEGGNEGPEVCDKGKDESGDENDTWEDFDDDSTGLDFPGLDQEKQQAMEQRLASEVEVPGDPESGGDVVESTRPPGEEEEADPFASVRAILGTGERDSKKEGLEVCDKGKDESGDENDTWEDFDDDSTGLDLPGLDQEKQQAMEQRLASEAEVPGDPESGGDVAESTRLPGEEEEADPFASVKAILGAARSLEPKEPRKELPSKSKSVWSSSDDDEDLLKPDSEAREVEPEAVISHQKISRAEEDPVTSAGSLGISKLPSCTEESEDHDEDGAVFLPGPFRTTIR